MAGPWEQFQNKTEAGPWDQFKSKPQAGPWDQFKTEAAPETTIQAGPWDQFKPQADTRLEALTTDFGDVTSGRTYPQAEAETEGGINPFAALEFIDRPRSAVVSGVIAAAEQEQFNPEEIKAEAYKGISGEQNPLMGEYFAEKVKNARENPEEYPMLSKAYDWLNNQLESSFGIYRTQATVQEAITSGLLGDFIRFKTAETENEKEDARLQLNTSLNQFAENVTDYYKEGAAIESAARVVGFGADVGLDPVTYANPIIGFVKQGGRYLLKAVPDSVVDSFAKAGNTTKEKAKEFLTTNKVGRPIGEAADWAWSLFSTKHNLEKKGDAAVLQERFMNMVANARVQAIREGRDFQNRIKDFSRETGVPESDVEKFITEAVERGGVQNVDYKYLPKESVDLLANNDNIRYEVWSLGQRNADQLQKEIDAGIRISPLEEQALVRQPTTATDPVMQEYMARAITPEAREAINIKRAALKLKPIGEREPIRLTGGHGSVIQRSEDWEGLTIQDINQLARDGNLPGYEGTKFDKGFFYDDPAISQAIRDDRHYRSMAAKQLADSIIDPTAGFATSPDTVMQMAREAGWVPKGKKQDTVNNALQFLKEKDPNTWQFFDVSKNPLTEGFVMDRDIIKFVDDNINSVYNPKEVNKFLNKWDQVTGWWKSWTLSIFPSYHFRNSVGNMWNNFVVGVDNMAYRDAYKFQDAMFGSRYIDNSGVGGAEAFAKQAGDVDRAYGTYKTKDGTEYSYTQLRDMMDEYGVIGRGFMSMDIETTLRSEMGDAKWLTLSRENKAIEIGKRTGEALENNARIANFLDGLNKGLSPSEAAARVKKTLFDYSDLTEAEQSVFKRLAPFYTWTRKNIPFQIEGMVKHPGKYKGIDTLRQNVEAAVSEENENEKYLASWMLENYPTKVKIDEETGDPRYFIMGGWLPAADVWKLAAAPKRVVVDNLHPALKVLYEMTSADEKGFVTDLFTGQKLHPELTTDYIGMEMPETTAHYLNNLRVLATVDDFYQVYLNETGQAPQKLSPFAGKGKTAEEALIAFLTGFRTYAVNLENQRLFKLMEKERESGLYEQLYGTSIKRGTPQPELIDKAIEPFREMRSKGGMLDQSRRLFRKGGYLRTRKGYAEGGSVTDEEAERDPESVSTEGIDTSSSVRPEYLANQAAKNTIAAATFLPGLAADVATGNLGKGIYQSTKAVLTGDDKEYEWTPNTRKLQEQTEKLLGVKDIPAQSTEEEVLGFLADPTLAIGGWALKPVKSGKQLFKAMMGEAPNELPGFYSGPVGQAASATKGAGQAVVSAAKTVTNPQRLADAMKLGIPGMTRDVIQRNVDVLNKYAGKKTLTAEEKKAVNTATKVITGQLTYNANLAKQVGYDSPILNRWMENVNKEITTYNRSNIDLIDDYSTVRNGMTKTDLDTVYDHLGSKEAWGIKKGEDVQMVVRPTVVKGGAGDFSSDMRKTDKYKTLTEVGQSTRDPKELASKLQDAGMAVKKVDGDEVWVTFSMKSSSYAEGGVNVIGKVNSKTGDFNYVVSDEHDMFGFKPPGGKRLITVTPASQTNIYKMQKVTSKTPKAKPAETPIDLKEVKTDTKARLLEKNAAVPEWQRDIINQVLSTRSQITAKDVGRVAVGTSAIAGNPKEQEFAEGGIVEEVDEAAPLVQSMSRRLKADENQLRSDLETVKQAIKKHESGNQNIYQISKGMDRGPAAGYYQFEQKQYGGSGAAKTAVNRTLNSYKMLKQPVPQWLQQLAKDPDPDFTLLDERQQDVIFLGNLNQERGSDKLLKNVVTAKDEAAKKKAIEDLWRKAHKKVKATERFRW